jgi:hypothetical protein
MGRGSGQLPENAKITKDRGHRKKQNPLKHEGTEEAEEPEGWEIRASGTVQVASLIQYVRL